jgi:hypothetical protein
MDTDIRCLIAVLELADEKYPGAELRKSRVGNLCLIVNDEFVAWIDLTTYELEEVAE